jgi:hypothetical protein
MAQHLKDSNVEMARDIEGRPSGHEVRLRSPCL